MGSIVSLYEKHVSDIGLLKYLLNVLYEHECEELAERLIRKFGSFNGAFDATREELMSVTGITARAAAFFTFAKPAFRQAVARASDSNVIDSEASLARFLLVYFMNTDVSGEYCIYLSDNGKVSHCERIEGEIVRSVVGNVCRYGAYRSITVSYRPHCPKPEPSVRKLDDIMRLNDALAAVGARLVDHIEYAPFKLFSLVNAINGIGVIDITAATGKKLSDIADDHHGLTRYVQARNGAVRRAYLNDRT